MESPSEIAKRELLSWPGVTVHDHRFGGLEFRVNGMEMGHMHGDGLADMPFPKDVGRMLIEHGKVSPHHFLPESGWISYYINGAADVPGLVELSHAVRPHDGLWKKEGYWRIVSWNSLTSDCSPSTTNTPLTL